MMENVTCPICEAEVEVAAETIVGEILECGDCGTELEVVGINPTKVEEAPEVEEDWGEQEEKDEGRRQNEEIKRLNLISVFCHQISALLWSKAI